MSDEIGPVTYNEARKAREGVGSVLVGLPRIGSRLRLSFPIFTSRTWIAPMDGVAVIRSVAPGGSAARGIVSGSSATGGYSGAWGCKVVRVKKSDTITIVHGAPGSYVNAGGNGVAGGNNAITIAGVTYTLPGGPAGIYAASSTPVVPDGPQLPSGWDFGAASVKPGAATPIVGAAVATGGAGVDILMQGNNATTSASSSGSGGGGTGGPSNGTAGGGATPDGKSALGDSTSTFDASNGEWGISFYGGTYGATAPGGNGGGGNGAVQSSTYAWNGGPGGGGGAATNIATVGGDGGYGGGGGASGSNASNRSGAGGKAYTHIELFADVPV